MPRRSGLVGLVALVGIAVVLAPAAGAGGPPATKSLSTTQRAWDRYGDAGHNDRWTGGQLAGSARLPDKRWVFDFATSYLGTVKAGNRSADTPAVDNLLVVAD